MLADKTLIGPEDLDLGGDQQRAVVPLTQAREDFTRQYILEVLERNGGNRTRTARTSGSIRGPYSDTWSAIPMPRSLVEPAGG